MEYKQEGIFLFMSKTRSKFIAAFLGIAMFSSVAVCPMQAAESSNQEDHVEIILNNNETGITPYWNNVNRATLAFSRANSNFLVSLTITGREGTTYKNGTITITCLTLPLAPILFTGLSGSSSLFTFTDNSKPATLSGTYRVSYSIEAVRGGVSETISDYRDLTF